MRVVDERFLPGVITLDLEAVLGVPPKGVWYSTCPRRESDGRKTDLKTILEVYFTQGWALVGGPGI